MIESSDCVSNYAPRGFIAIPSHMIAAPAGKELPRLDFEEEMLHTAERKGVRQSDSPMKRSRKEAAFDNHRIQIQNICKCKLLLQHIMKLQFQVTSFSIIHLIINFIPHYHSPPSFDH